MKAVIQAGGKGTRISSITGDTIPKPMLEISGFPILYHQIINLKRSGITDIHLIIGHLGEVIKDYFKDGKQLGINITYFEENPEKPLGTAGALYHMKEDLKEDFIFLLADVFIDIDFKKMIQFHQDKKSSATLLTHPNSHPFDSDLVVADEKNKVNKFDYKTNDRTTYDYTNLVNAGIMIFSSEALDTLTENKKYSYEKDIIVPLISQGKVFSYKSTEYAKDMGTPERYEGVQKDYDRNVVNGRNLQNKQKCIFLDRDGTINKHIPFLSNKNEFELIPGSAEAIRKINNSEYLCIVVTNQPIIARGESTVENLEDIHKRMDTLLGKDGAFIDGLYYCPHHPHKGYEGEIPELKIECECRKPNIGMIINAVKDYNIDLTESILIGDTTLDIECANRAGIKSILVKTGEGGLDGKFDSQPDYIADNLLEAVNIVLEKEKKHGFQKSN
ncbi:MAG: HAD-IIIA family hydrolase [Bacilli bacterium]|nr:HAD-IIIA family hydrolase [Bacilli bacterium]